MKKRNRIRSNKKIIVKSCLKNWKFSITANQLLETMIKYPFLTRAKIIR